MNVFILCSILINFFIPIYAMDSAQQHMSWVTTLDNHLMPISKQITAQSALLTMFKRPKTNPLPIFVNKKDLILFWAHITISAKELRNSLDTDKYYALVDVADNLRAPTIYANLIDEIVPPEVSRLFIPEYIKNAYRNDIIQRNCTSNELLSGKLYNSDETPKMILCNDGRYLMHNIRLNSRGIEFKLWDTKKHSQLKEFFSQYRFKFLRFSPNNKYIIVRGHPTILVYDIAEDKEYPLILPQHFELIEDIIISPDSKHIMISGRQENSCYPIYHALWSFDEHNIPQSITLSYPLWNCVHSATFHPDNNHIIYPTRRKTLHSCPIASTNNITEKENGKCFTVSELTVSKDDTYLLAENDYGRNKQGFGQALFNIENFDNITCTEIPNQSFSMRYNSKSRSSETQDLARLCIPYKKLLTHVSDSSTILNFLDTNACLVASHEGQSDVSALAVDKTGNYLASGYTDGTIVIWDLSNSAKRICGKKVIAAQGIIKKLTFDDNQLLLVQPDCHSPRFCQGCSTTLWDVHGNKILDLGKIKKSVMSKHGNRIITLAEKISARGDWKDHFVTLTAWNLHNKKTTKKLDTKIKTLTLSQALEFYNQYKHEQGKHL